MKLSPSLRQKKRYVLFEIISQQQYSCSEIEAAVQEALQHFLGQLGVARLAPLLIKEQCRNNKFILKVNHQYVDEAKAALILIKKIKNQPVIMRSIITSGTLEQAAAKL